MIIIIFQPNTIMDYTIALVSGGRANSKNFKTLNYFNNIKAPFNKVILFLEENQKKEYSEREDVKNAVSLGSKIVWINTVNIADARNYIEREYFKTGDLVLCVDDDINYMSYMFGGEIKKVQLFEELDYMIKKYFKLCIENNSKLFGVYPIARNHLWFSKARDMIGNNHILAAFSGVIIDNSLPKQNLDLYSKEEYERAFIYGKNIRAGNLAIDSRWYQSDGIGPRSHELQLKTCETLALNYPQLVTDNPLKINKKNNNVDLKLNKKYYL